MPYKLYGFPHGASNARQAALLKQQVMNNKLQNLVNTHGGNKITVPSFSQGNDISPINPTSISINGNKNAMQSLADAVGDCYATNTCGAQKGGYRNWYDAFPPGSFNKRVTGGKKHNKKHRNKK